MTVIFDKEEEAINWALSLLASHNFACWLKADLEMVAPAELARRFGLTPPAVHYRLKHDACPPTPRDHGPAGRLVRVALTPELQAWLERPSHAGRL